MFARVAYSGASVASRAFASFIVFILIARELAPADFGAFSFTFALVTVLALFLDFGMPLLLMTQQRATRCEMADMLRRCLGTKSFLLPLYALVAALCAFLSGDELLVLILAASAAVNSYSETIVAVARYQGDYLGETLSVSLGSSALFLAVIAGKWFGSEVHYYALCFLLARTVSFTITVLRTRSVLLGQLKWSCSKSEAISLMKAKFNYAMDGVVTAAFGNVDVVAVKVIFGEATLGLFSAAQRLVQGLMLFAPTLANVFLPKMSADRDGRSQLLSMNVMAGTGFALSALVAVLPASLYTAVLGSGYQSVGRFMGYFAVVVFCRYAAASSGILLSAIGMQRQRIFCQIGSLVVFVGACGLVWILGISVVWVILSLALAYFALWVAYFLLAVPALGSPLLAWGAFIFWLAALAGISLWVFFKV